MFKPTVSVTPGALNFNHASMKLIALTNPTQVKDTPMRICQYFIPYILKAWGRNQTIPLCRGKGVDHHLSVNSVDGSSGD